MDGKAKEEKEKTATENRRIFSCSEQGGEKEAEEGGKGKLADDEDYIGRGRLEICTRRCCSVVQIWRGK